MSNRGDLLRVRARFEATQAEQEPRLDRFLALMGDGQGNLSVTGSPLFVYVRVLGRGVVECLNQIAPLRNDLPIIVGYDFKKPDTLQVLSIYEGGMASLGPYAYLPAHHQAHEFRNASGGDDVVWIQKQAVIPLLCRPTSPTTMFVEVLADNYPWLGGWNLFPGATSANLGPRVPALPGEARFVLIYVNGATNLLGYLDGAIFPAAWPPGTAFSLTPAPPAGTVPVVSVYLPNGITAIDWPNLYDVRLFNQPIGGSVTPGPHALLDNAVHSDTVTNTPPAQGSIVVADATPEWDELVHPGGAGYALTTDATDVVWDQTPTWTGNHTFNAGLTVPAAQGITMGDLAWIGLGPAAGRLTFDDAVPDVASFDGCGHVDIENVLGHIGDADTYLIFAPDSIVLRAGGVDLIHATTVGVDRIEINPNEDDVDFIVNSNGLADAFLVDGATGAISVTGPSLTVPGAWNLIVPDNVADAFGIDDVGGLEYVRIVSSNANPYFLINPAGVAIQLGVGTAAPDALYASHFYETASAMGLLKVEGTALDFTIPYVGAYFAFTKTAGASDHDDWFYGTFTNAVLDQAAGEIGHFYAGLLYVTLIDGNVGDAVNNRYMIGQIANANLDGGKVWGTAIGLWAQVDQEAANEVTADIRGLSVWVDAAGTVGGNVYLLYLDAGVNVDYGVYQLGAIDNYFAGSVGIGVLPTYKLDVATDHAAGWAANFFNDGDNVNRYGVRIQCGDDDADTAGTAYHLIFYDGDGDGCGGVRTIAGVTAIYQTSDEKLKKDIRPTTRKGLEEISALPVRDFKWKKSKKTDPFQTGFVAQEVEKVIPRAVGELDDIKTLSTAYFIPMLVKAVQELDVRLSQVETH